MSTIPVVAVVPSHISLDDKGVARISGTRMKVLHIAIERRFHNATPEQMKDMWPHLSLAQIHSALAYYYDHQAEIDARMDRDQEELEKTYASPEVQNDPLRQKLRQIRESRERS